MQRLNQIGSPTGRSTTASYTDIVARIKHLNSTPLSLKQGSPERAGDQSSEQPRILGLDYLQTNGLIPTVSDWAEVQTEAETVHSPTSMKLATS